MPLLFQRGHKYKIYPQYAKLFQNAQKDVCKNNAIGQFDRYGREGVKGAESVFLVKSKSSRIFSM